MSHAAFRLHALSSAIAILLAAGPAQAQAGAPVAVAASAAEVQTVVVRASASADASADGLKAPYAGGQVARGGRVGILGSQDVMDTPFNITHYTQKLIQDQQARSIADVLDNDPAVRVSRGFGNYQQLYMVRGLPIYSDDMAYNGLYGLLPRQYLAAELVERVEVLRGASAFLDGAAPGGSGLGGAINVMPKRAPDDALTELTLGADSGGGLVQSADVARRFGVDRAFGLRVNAVNRSGGTTVAGENRTLDAVLVGADFHAGGVRVSADLGYQDHRLKASTPSITIASGLAIPHAPEASKQVAQPWTHSDERDTFGTLRAEVDVAAGVTAWVAGGFRDGKEAAVFANPTVTAADGASNTYRFDNARRDAIATGEAGVRARFATGSVRHTVVGSFADYSAGSRNAYALSDFGLDVGSIYAPTFIAAPVADVYTGGTLSDPLTTARTKTRSVAVADVLALLDERLLVTIGARDQKIQSSSYDYDTGARYAGAYSASRVTPVAGVVFKANRQVSLYATYIEGLVAGDVAPATVGSTVVTNAGEVFKPYPSKQVEVGVKVDTGRYGATASVFQTRKPIAAVDAQGHYGVADSQRNRGAELSVYGEALVGLRVLGGLSLLDTRVDGKRGIGAPASQFNLGLEWDVPQVLGLTLDTRVVHTASQYADAANTQAVPAWTRLDLGARYAFDVGIRVVTLRAGIDNVANRSYWASAGGYPGAGYLTVGAPRTVAVSGTIAF